MLKQLVPGATLTKVLPLVQSAGRDELKIRKRKSGKLEAKSSHTSWQIAIQKPFVLVFNYLDRIPSVGFAHPKVITLLDKL